MVRAINRLKGTVRWFNYFRGFGFITPEDGGEDLFVHQSSIKVEGFRCLIVGEFVEFYVEVGDDGRTRATDVTGPGGASVQYAIYGEAGHLTRNCCLIKGGPVTRSLFDSSSTMLESLTDKGDEVEEDAAEEDAAEEYEAEEDDEAEEDEAGEDAETEEDEVEAEEEEAEVWKAVFTPLNCSPPSSSEVLLPPPLPVATEPSTPPPVVVGSGEPQISSGFNAFSPLPKIKASITCMKQISEEELQLLTNLERYLKAMDLRWSDTIMEIDVLKGALAEAVNHKIGAVADSQTTVVVDLTHRCSALEERLAAMEAKMASVPTAPVIPEAVVPTTAVAENPIPVVDVVKAPTSAAAVVEVSTLIAVAAEEASVSSLAIVEAPSSVMVFEGLASVGATSVVPTLGEVAGRVFTEGYELALINMAKEGALPVSFLANSRVVPPSLPRYHELHCLALLHSDKIPPVDSAT